MSDLGALRQLELSLGAVRAVGGVVAAVSALARAQLPRAEEAVAQTGHYLAWLDRVVDELAGPEVPAPAERGLTVLLGPERAFCGDLAEEVLSSAPGESPVGVVGARVAEAASRRRWPVRFALPGPSGVDELESVTRAMAEAVLRETPTDAPAELVYPSVERRGLVRARILVARRGRPPRQRDLFSSPTRIAEAALRESVAGHLRAALAHTLLAETRARAAVADRARRAVEDREASLRGQLRVLERELITAEVTELTAAMEALADPRAGV